MKHSLVLLTLTLHLCAISFSHASSFSQTNSFSPETGLSSATTVSQAQRTPLPAAAQFNVAIDDRRTLRIEATDASETIIATIVGDSTFVPTPGSAPAPRPGRTSINIEYRVGNGTAAPQTSSFALEAFDRIVLNAGSGDDFVNIIDAAELLDALNKTMNLNGGDGDNIVVLSHRPFRPETAAQLKRLNQLAPQLEDIAKRATDATSQTLLNDTIKAIDNARLNLADAAQSLNDDAEKQLLSPARELVDQASRLTAVSDSFVAKSEGLAKRQADLVSQLTKKFDPRNGAYPPDDNSEPGTEKAEDDRVDVGPQEKEANLAATRVDQLSQAGLRLGTEIMETVDRSGKQIESEATLIEQRAATFKKSAEQLSTTADTLAAQSETDLTAASNRILAVVAELNSLAKDLQEAALAVHDELLLADSTTPIAKVKQAKQVAKPSPCTKPIAATNTYTGGNNSDIFFPFSAPSASWSINGQGGSDILFGGFADDDLHGGAGADILAGLKGDDHIHGDDGTDFLFGEFIVDSPSLIGSDCIWGGDGVDLVVGDNLIDTPTGTNGGSDFLWGDKGTDLVIGDDLFDVPNFPNLNIVSLEILSQTHLGGDDTIEGGDDMDLLFGDGGNDTIHGNAEMDFVEGNRGDDIIYGEDGRDFQFCNTTVHVGNLLMGGNDQDEVHGGKGIDLIFGDDERDRLFGAEQIDIMFGGAGMDEMHGNSGGQICSFKKVPIRLGNLMFGGTDGDRMDAGGDLDIMFGQDGPDMMYGYDGSGQQPFAIDTDIMFGGLENDYMEGDDESIILTNSLDYMFGGDGMDIMHGGSQSDKMFGGAGKDRMYGDSNSLLLVASIDLMFGGDDADLMDGGNALDLMFGERDNDTMQGDNETFGLISSDILFGGPGVDTMNGGSATDLMLGGSGDDHVIGDSNYWWQHLSNDFMFGQTGNDYMDGGNANDWMFGGPDCDNMLGDNNIPWRDSPDVMLGEAGDDQMDGGNSTDLMFGGDGNDRMVGDQDFWWQIFSGDWMFGNDGCDTMLGGTSIDWMFGGPGVDQMDGQRGPDMMFGGANSDVMNGGAALALMWGNDGNDLIHGDDFIDFIWGGDGDDCVYGDDGQDLIWGAAGNDCLHGGSHADILFGGDADDLIFGDNGPDVLFGNDGDDKLDGGSGPDILVGGPGGDELWGGPGLDLMSGEKKHQSGNSGLQCDCRIETCVGRICVHKFNDLNGDGIQNSNEPGLPNWSFNFATSCNIGKLITDANGDACGDFYPGTYSIGEELQNGWTPSTPGPQSVTVTAGSFTTIVFGNKRGGRGELCIFKFNDLDGDGVRDAGEPLLPGWTFTVTDSSGATNSLVTQQGGGVCSGLPVGTYSVQEIMQSGWTATTPTQQVVLSANKATNVYFGNRPGIVSPRSPQP